MKKTNALSINSVKPYLYVLPMAVVFGVFSVYPILRTFYLSLMETNANATQMKFIGLQNFREIFTDRYFPLILQNTLIFCAVSVAATVILGLLLAEIANHPRVKLRSFFRIAAFYPYLLPSAVAARVWIYLYNPMRGAINLIFDQRIQWLGDPHYALAAVLVVHIWKSLGFNFLLILAGMQNLSAELYEAAALETNSRWKCFFRITVPMMKPTLFLVVLLSATSSFQSMDLIALMTQGDPGNASNVLAYYIYQEGIINRRIGYGSAASVILLLFLLGFTIIYLYLEKRSVDYER